jgi:type II secretory pathway component PulC
MQRAVEWLATLLAAAAVAVVVAWWGWRWFGPAPFDVPHRSTPETAPALALSLSPPFGVASDAAVATAPAASTAGELRLLGVIAERDGGGQALFRFADGSARLVVAGTRLSDAATLVAVRPDGVTVRDSGGERTIPLRAATARAAAARSATPARSAACAIPRDFRGAVVRLNAELLLGLIGDPQSLRAVVDAQDGALVVRDETGFATMLGLRKGDRVSQANGIALRAPEDVVVSILRPLAASQSVRVQGNRGAESRELLILNAGACPG